MVDVDILGGVFCLTSCVAESGTSSSFVLSVETEGNDELNRTLHAESFHRDILLKPIIQRPTRLEMLERRP